MSEKFKAGQKVRIVDNSEFVGHFFEIGSEATLVTGEVDILSYRSIETYELCGTDPDGRYDKRPLHQWLERYNFILIED